MHGYDIGESIVAQAHCTAIVQFYFSFIRCSFHALVLSLSLSLLLSASLWFSLFPNDNINGFIWFEWMMYRTVVLLRQQIRHQVIVHIHSFVWVLIVLSILYVDSLDSSIPAFYLVDSQLLKCLHVRFNYEWHIGVWSLMFAIDCWLPFVCVCV